MKPRRRWRLAAIAIFAFATAQTASADSDPVDAALARLSVTVTPKQRTVLLSGHPVVELHESSGSSIKEGIALALVACAPEALYAVVTDNAKFGEFMPHVKTSTIVRDADGTVANHQELSLPFPIADRHYTIRIVNTLPDEQGARIWQSAWTYVAASGNVKETRGAWMVTEAGTGKAILYYRVYTDPGGMVPAWASNMATRRALPDLLEAVVRRACAPANP